MPIQALDPSLAELIDLNAEPEKVATGYRSTEGPVWHSRDRTLTFSDLSGSMHRWSEKDGASVLRDPSGGGNGNTYDHMGLLVTCEQQGRRVSRTLADGSVETLIDRYKGRRLNYPNDIICAPNGDLIFTDPSFGMRQRDGTKIEMEYPYEGVFRFSPRDGSMRLLVDDLFTPNGLAMTDDGGTLYIIDSVVRQIRAYDVEDDGRLSKGRLFIEVQYGKERTTPDGMKLDSLGNIYVATNTESGVWVYDPRGRLLGMIGVGEGPTNLAWGGDDWKTMFVTARSSVYRLPMKVAGQPVRLS